MFAGETVRFVRMKKIIEVVRYGENDIRFHTDIDPLKNRRQMVGFLDDASGMLEASIRDARRAFEQSGGKIMVFGPGVAPPKSRS